MRILPELRPSFREAVIGAMLRWSGSAYQRNLNQAAQDLGRAQEDLLRSILKSHAETDFGRKHGFAGISNFADYRVRIPVMQYEDLRPWIENQDRTGRPALLPEGAVLYAMTSGTTGKPKYIPVTEESLKDYARIQRYFLSKLLARRPKLFRGRILAIVSPAQEGRMAESNIPYGSTSGHMYAAMGPFSRSKYVVPVRVFDIDDADLKYMTILRLALERDDITYLSTANPSTISKLLALLNQHLDAFLVDLEVGTFHKAALLSESVRDEVVTRISARPERARALHALRKQRGAGGLQIRDLWPHLQAIGCWTGGSCAIFLDKWKEGLPAHTLVQEIGYLSSEFRGTVPVEPGPAGLPTLLEHVFEFVERDAWEDGRAEFRGLHELKRGSEYYVFVTTRTGLYRYDINDIVRVESFLGPIPRLRFMQKGKGVTNITGEKLHESQLIAAVHAVETQLGLSSSFFMAAADEAAASYVLYYQPSDTSREPAKMFRESLADALDDELRRMNLEYEAKRKSGRLLPLQVRVLDRGAFDAFRTHSINAGQREGQFKIVALQYRKNLRFDFERHEESRS